MTEIKVTTGIEKPEATQGPSRFGSLPSAARMPAESGREARKGLLAAARAASHDLGTRGLQAELLGAKGKTGRRRRRRRRRPSKLSGLVTVGSLVYNLSTGSWARGAPERQSSFRSDDGARRRLFRGDRGSICLP